FLKKEGEDRIDHFIVKLVASVTPPGEVTTNSPAVGTNAPAAIDDSDAAQSTTANANPGELHPEGAEALASPKKEIVDVQARKAIARNINQFIQNTRSGTLGVTGGILLIFAAISMLTRIEDTLNDIWGVRRGRSWFMRIVLYW